MHDADDSPCATVETWARMSRWPCAMIHARLVHGEERPGGISMISTSCSRAGSAGRCAIRHDTMVLDLAERDRTLVVNRPPEPARLQRSCSPCTSRNAVPPTVVAAPTGGDQALRRRARRRRAETARRHGRTQHLPLAPRRPNLNVILRDADRERPRLRHRQKFIPEILAATARALLIDGE